MKSSPNYLSCFIHIQFLTHFAMSVAYCYGLNDYVLSKFLCLNCNTHCNGFRKWGLLEVI